MPEYLSDAWFDELNDAIRGAGPLVGRRDDVALGLQQIVVDTPEGDVAYWLALDDGTATTGRGRLASADLTITQSYETAVAVVRGELSTEAAFLAGRVRLSGDLRALTTHQARFRQVAAAAAAVRDRTTFA